MYARKFQNMEQVMKGFDYDMEVAGKGGEIYQRRLLVLDDKG